MKEFNGFIDSVEIKITFETVINGQRAEITKHFSEQEYRLSNINLLDKASAESLNAFSNAKGESDA